MIITCAQCHTKFRVNSGQIKATGTRVRCSNCQAVFIVTPPPPREAGAESGSGPGREPRQGAGWENALPRAVNGPPPAQGGLEELDRELDSYFQGPGETVTGTQSGLGLGDRYPGGQASYASGEAGDLDQPLTAIPPKRAENNPINLILGNGDSFVVPDGTGLKPSSSAPLTAGPDLGLGADPVSHGPIGRAAFGAAVWPGASEAEVGPGEGMAVLGAMAGEPGFGLGDGALAYAGPGALAGTEPGLGGGFEDTDNGPILREPSPKLFTNGQKVLLLVFSVVAAGLVIATLFMSLGSGSGEVPPVQGQGQGLGQGQVQEARAGGGEAEAAMGEVRGPGEEEAAMKFSIPSDITSHHYIENAEAGMILVLTGLINNDNDRAVSFIRLKAVLADADNKVLAERHVFAGNLFTEEELKNLSMKEILSRLALKGGQNGTNTNVLPGKQVPYMFVFDKLPTDISNFTIAPVSSEPAAQT